RREHSLLCNQPGILTTMDHRHIRRQPCYIEQVGNCAIDAHGENSQEYSGSHAHCAGHAKYGKERANSHYESSTVGESKPSSSGNDRAGPVTKPGSRQGNSVERASTLCAYKHRRSGKRPVQYCPSQPNQTEQSKP